MKPSPERAASVAKALSGFLWELRRRAAQPRVRTAIYAGAITALGVGLYFAVRNLPADLSLEHWRYIWLNLAVGAPLGIFLNVAETELSARLLGASFGWRQALRISVLSSAANVLPFPGGPLVRTAALNSLGLSLARSGGVVAAVAAQWFGMIFLYAGAWLWALAHGWIGGPFLVVGLAVFVGSVAWMRRLDCSFRQIAIIGAVKMLASALSVASIWWTFAALGLFLSFGEASVFTVVGVTGAAVSIVPAGLGVNEAMAAAIATVIAVPPAMAFIVATVNRIIRLAVVFPLAAFLALNSARRPVSAGPGAVSKAR